MLCYLSPLLEHELGPSVPSEPPVTQQWCQVLHSRTSTPAHWMHGRKGGGWSCEGCFCIWASPNAIPGFTQPQQLTTRQKHKSSGFYPRSPESETLEQCHLQGIPRHSEDREPCSRPGLLKQITYGSITMQTLIQSIEGGL